jgi:DNA-binding transcriptional LysR family regulator
LAFPVVLPELPVWAREWFASHLSQGLAPGDVAPAFQPSVLCSHFSTLRQIVLASDAVSATTELALNRSPYLNQMAGIAFKGATPSSNPGIVTLKKRRLPPVAQELIEEVVRISEVK